MKQYTKKELRHICVSSGYADSKTVTRYYKENPKPFYTQDDILPIYRMMGSFADIKRTTKRKT